MGQSLLVTVHTRPDSATVALFTLKMVVAVFTLENGGRSMHCYQSKDIFETLHIVALTLQLFSFVIQKFNKVFLGQSASQSALVTMAFTMPKA